MILGFLVLKNPLFSPSLIPYFTPLVLVNCCFLTNYSKMSWLKTAVFTGSVSAGQVWLTWVSPSSCAWSLAGFHSFRTLAGDLPQLLALQASLQSISEHRTCFIWTSTIEGQRVPTRGRVLARWKRPWRMADHCIRERTACSCGCSLCMRSTSLGLFHRPGWEMMQEHESLKPGQKLPPPHSPLGNCHGLCVLRVLPHLRLLGSPCPWTTFRFCFSSSLVPSLHNFTYFLNSNLAAPLTWIGEANT